MSTHGSGPEGPAVSSSLLPRAALPPLRPHPHLYQIGAWPWLEALEARLGRRLTLGAVPDAAWDEIARLGFDLVYLMGVWKRSPRSRTVARTDGRLFADYERALPGWQLDDVVGSPFAIGAYTPDPRLGSWADLLVVRQKLGERGMRLVLDLVPNHTGLDHPWVKEHPEYYVQGDMAAYRERPGDFFLAEDDDGRCTLIAHGRDPHFPPWTDTAQLNVFSPGLRQALAAEVAKIARYCDGLRCDMAMLLLHERFARTWGPLLGDAAAPPVELWRELIAAVPELLWIAEVYSDLEYPLQQLGFHYTYDKKFYDHLLHGSPAAARAHLGADWAYQARSVRFLENHDEARAAAAFGTERLPAIAVLLATAPGMRFFHDGQLDGRRLRLPVQLAHAVGEPPDPEVRRQYETLLAVASGDVFHHGRWTLLEPHTSGDDSSGQLFAYLWRLGERTWLVVVNLGARPATARFYLPGDALPAAELVLRDALDGRRYPRGRGQLGAEGLYVRLEAYGAHLFEITPGA